MMRRIKNIILSACLLLFANTGFAQDVKGFELALDKDTILIGDHITLSVKFKFNPRFIPSFPQIKDTIVPGVELVRELGVDTIREQNEISEYVKKYVITSFDSGHYAIMFPIIFENHDEETSDTVASNLVEFHVNTLPIDTLTYQMFDIKTTIKYPLTFKEILFWILIALGVIALVVVGIILYRRWKNKQPLFGKAKPKIPPHVLAFKELSSLKSEKLWQQGKTKLYYTKITDILRVYIEGRFSITAMEKTSDEILADIKKKKIDQLYSFDKLREMFYTSDLVKFAKYEPASSENETSFSTAFEFVTSTQPQVEQEENTDTEKISTLKEEKKEESTDA
jgi:hypothetical protein